MTMNILFDWLLPQNFLPHGHCYLWRPDVLWLHVISDAVIAASYYAIPLALAYFVHRRRAVLPYWWMPVLFAMFIFLCGTTHVLNIWTVWRPDYIVDGLVKLATALASASTAVLVFAALPQAVALRTPIELQAEVETRTGELRAANERLRHEIAAREENELRMRLALEASGAATWMIDYTRAANEHFDARSCELAGLDPTQADWPAGTFCKLLHPDDRELMQRVFSQTGAMARPGPLVEYRIFTARRELRWLQGAGIVQRNMHGEPERFIGVSTDITERKRVEGQLKRNSALIELSFEPSLVWTLDGAIVEWNRGCVEVYGYAREEVIGRTSHDLLKTRFPQPLAEIVQQLEIQGRWGGELQHVTREGKAVIVESRWQLMRMDSQSLVLETNRDITVRKQTEAALAARTAELRQTFNAAATGLTRCSRELHYIAANPTYAEIAGIPLQQIIGRPIIDVMGREGFEKIRPYVERVLQGESVEYETPVPFSRGGTRLLHVAYAPWREADGSVSGWVASVTDVTARHRAEEKLKAASRQKDEFLAMLAHELRNPLAPICNATVLLERWLGSNAEAKAPLAILRRQTRQLIRLVDDLLDVARISEGQINLKKETIEIGAVLDQAVEMIQLLVQAKLHRLNIHKPFSPVYVHGDFARLVQSLGNILHNAAKYTDLGGEIEVDVKESSGELMIAVRDTGSGIAPDLLPNVFDLFIQGHSTADRAEGGLGIGLTVVKKIIQLHGGSVSADSPGVGCGTTVTVNLPTVESASAPEPEDVRFIASRRRVLVVDDNEDAANSLAMMLRLEGHEVSTVFSASGALSAADRSKPEIIFLDIGLPQMDGYEVARRLRAQLGSACPRLIALTGYGQPEDRARARTVGFAAHVTKPIDLQRLQQVLSANSDPAATAT
jgi:PAS domain S-box-containing protein